MKKQLENAAAEIAAKFTPEQIEAKRKELLKAKYDELVINFAMKYIDVVEAMDAKVFQGITPEEMIAGKASLLAKEILWRLYPDFVKKP